MSTSVDNRVVQLEFDNKDFKSRVKDTLGDLATLSEMLSKDMDIKGLQNAVAVSNNMKMDDLGSAIDGINEKFSLMGVMALNVFNRISNAVIDTAQKIVQGFAIEPIKQGFEEYELELGSVQTIVASTGEATKKVYGYLDQLNTYADKTIYSFSDMTASIGKFTNAGVNLDSAVSAIQGIANEAAVSGANTQEASRAMYNFAQALSAGSVKLIDWKSIENANMATVEFKQELIDTAVALGTVTKGEEGYVSTTEDMQGKVSEAFTATMGFNDSLSHQWMTTEVLVEALSHYSTDVRDMTKAEKKAYEERLKGIGYNDEQIKKIEKLGKKAFDAAQDVKSFSQLIDTLKEAAGSGWTLTWKLIFGDLKEAKKLWTGVNNVLSSFIDGISDYRNEMLQYWHDTGGRENVIQGLANVFQFLGKVMGPVEAAFNEIFGGLSSTVAGVKLSNLSKQFLDWSESLQLTNDKASALTNVFKGVFNAIKTVGTVLSGVFDGALSIVIPLLQTFFDIISTAGGVAGKFVSNLTESGDAAQSIADAFRNAGQFVGDFIENFRSGLPAVSDFDGILSSIKEKLDSVGNGFKEFAKGIGSGLLDVINELKPGVSEFLGNMGIGDMFAMMNAQGLVGLAGALLGIKKSIDEFLGVDSWIKEGFEGITSAMESFKGTLQAYQTQLNAKSLLAIGLAVASLAVGLAILSQIDPGSLTKAGVAMGAMMIGLVSAFQVLGQLASAGKGMAAMAPTLLAFAGAIAILSLSLAALSKLDANSLAKGGIAIGAMLGALVIAIQALDGVSAKVVAAGAAMVFIAGAMLILSGAIAVLSVIPAENLEKALFALGAGLLELGIALQVMQHSIGGAAALTIAAVGVLLLTPALIALSFVPIENICNALMLLGGAILILGLAAGALQPVIVPMMGLGVALALIGVGAVGLGVGLLAVATAFNIIAVTGAGAAFAVTEVLKAIVKGLADTMPEVGQKIAEGFASFVEAVASNGERIVDAVVSLLSKILDGIEAIVPRVVEMVLAIVDRFVASIAEHLPSIIESGISMVVSLIEGITQGMPQIAQASFDAVIQFVNTTADAIRDNHQAMYDAGYNLFTAILEALTDLVGDILGGVVDLGSQIIDTIGGFFDGIFGASEENGKAIEEGIRSGGGGARDAAEDVMDEATSSVNAAAGDMEVASAAVGSAVPTGMSAAIDPLTGEVIGTVNNAITGVEGLSGNANAAGSKVGTGFVSGEGQAMSRLQTDMTSKTRSAVSAAGNVSSRSEGSGVGSDFGAGMLAGLAGWIGPIAAKAAEMVRSAKSSAKAEQHSNSPSKDMIKVGGWFGEGYAIGIDRTISQVASSASSMVDGAKKPVEESMLELQHIVSGLDMVDDQPIIRPVLDTSDVQRGMSDISYMLAQRQTLSAGYVASKYALSAGPESQSTSTSSSTFNIALNYNAGADANQMVRDLTMAIKQSTRMGA